MELLFRTCLASLLLCVITSIGNAQKSLALDCIAAEAVRVSEPKWKLAEIFVRKSQEEDSVTFRWKYGVEPVSASISEYESLAKASEVLAQDLRTISVGSYSKLGDTGDESYVYL